MSLLGPDQLVASESNQKAQAALIARIATGEAALFAGAGVAVPAGFPSWNRLLEDLEKLCDVVGDGFSRDSLKRANSHLLYAEAIKTHIKHCVGNLVPYETFLLKTFQAAPQLKQFHRDLVALPFRGFITTNYDRTLETALAELEWDPSDKTVVVGVDDRRIAHDFIAGLAAGARGRLVAHIHGYYKHPNQIVLSESDYMRAYGLNEASETVLARFLSTVLGFASLVFVGFSFQDEQIGNFLAATSELFGLGGAGTHYAIIGTTVASAERDRERARQYMKLGIETVFYERLSSSEGAFDEHQQLHDMVGAFRNTMRVHQQPPSIVDFNDAQADRMRG